MSDDKKEPEVNQPKQEITTDIERLLATGERLLAHQQGQLVRVIMAHETARTALMNEYRLAQAKMKHEADERLRQLDIDHEERVNHIHSIIKKLNAMRDA